MVRAQVAALSASGCDDTAMVVAELRRNIDLACFRAYGLDGEDAALVLSDFLSLDRGEPPLPGERRSTVTRDFILSASKRPTASSSRNAHKAALSLGAGHIGHPNRLI